jgi:hypothetical protein
MKEVSYIILTGMLLVSVLSGCNGAMKRIALDDCPVVASVDQSGVVVCDLASVRDTIEMPLSSLLSDFEIVRLEYSDEALVSDGYVWIGGNFIGTYSYKDAAYKLFDRTGKFISTITTRGQGPDEFLGSIYDSYIDESRKEIYILPFRASKIMVFDLKGNAQKPVPLPFIVHKGRMKINVEKRTLVITALAFSDTPYVVWEQDFDGNILQAIPAGRFVIDPGDYGNEVESTNTDDIAYSLFRWMPKVDSLFHYDETGNVMTPKFTAHFASDVTRHSYWELPKHYVFIDHSTKGVPPTMLIDKQTLKGAYVKWKLDMLGIDIDFASFNQGYYTASMHPSSLKEQLETTLAHPENLTAAMQQKLTELNGSITDDDNNIIMIGKLK